MREAMKVGYPPEGIPPADPMFREKIDFSLSNPPLLDVNLVTTNIIMKGLSTFKLGYIRANKNQKYTNLYS